MSRPEAAATVAVVGGGPAGLIAAEVLASAGITVTVYEHKRSVGRKFLLAGRGGLNITHAEPFAELVERYGARKPQLERALRSFSPDDLRRWCANLGETTFVGSSERVFPESFRATPLLRAWLGRLDALGVTLSTGHRWTGWNNDGALRFDTDEGAIEVVADASVFALGGASWPRVGSDGTWAKPFADAGHDVVRLQAANSGAIVEWSWVMRTKFAGEPIKNATFGVGGDWVRGDAVITDTGLEGGPIYALGPAFREQIAAQGSALLELDLFPDLSLDQVTARLSKRRAKASVASWLRSAGVAPMAGALGREATQNQMPSEPREMAQLFKQLSVHVIALAPLERAISTAGGLSFDEVDDRYMLRSRPGTFVAGEMLDWEAPTGGYLLQACFSTGVAAAQGLLAWLH